MKNLKYSSKDLLLHGAIPWMILYFKIWTEICASLVAWIPLMWGFIHNPSFLYILKLLGVGGGVSNDIF